MSGNTMYSIFIDFVIIAKENKKKVLIIICWNFNNLNIYIYVYLLD